MNTFMTEEKLTPVQVSIKEGRTKNTFYIYGKTSQEIEEFIKTWTGNGDAGSVVATKRSYRKRTPVASSDATSGL